jgi:pseudouridine-5'-monophosphatase
MREQGSNKLSTPIRGVAFDMDGLLLNTEDLYGEAGEILMSRRGKSYRDEVRRKMIGHPDVKAFSVLIEEEGLEESWEVLAKETEEILYELLPNRLDVMPGVWEMLDRLEKLGLPKCVATSSTRSFATTALGIVKVYERMDFILTAADVPFGKPAPDIYLASAAKMGIDPETMLVLEDSPTGTKAGVAAGAYVVSVPNAHTQYGTFEGAQWIGNTLLDPRFSSLFA